MKRFLLASAMLLMPCIAQAQTSDVQIVGKPSSVAGTYNTPVQVSPDGSLYTKLRGTTGQPIGDDPSPLAVRYGMSLSTPLDATVTSSAVTVSQTCNSYSVASGAVVTTPNQPCGAATFASGVAYLGPLTPTLGPGHEIRVVLKGTWAGTVQIGTSSAANACAAGTINALTIGGGTPWGKYTGNANEDVDTPHLSSVVYCATATITSGSLSIAVRQ